MKRNGQRMILGIQSQPVERTRQKERGGIQPFPRRKFFLAAVGCWGQAQAHFFAHISKWHIIGPKADRAMASTRRGCSPRGARSGNGQVGGKSSSSAPDGRDFLPQ